MNLRLFFISFLILALQQVSAQKISGYVMDEDEIPLSYTSVSLMQSPDSTLSSIVMSDSLGFYEFKVTPGSYYVIFGFIGFESSISAVFEVSEGQNIRVPNQLMKVQVTELEGVVITNKKPMIVKTARGLNVNVKDSPVLQSGNGKQVISKIPGVILNQDNSLSLKGKQNVLIYIDGKQSFMTQETLMQWLESMPASDIETIEVFDTPPAKFDAAGSAGIINVILKKGAALGFNGRIGLNTGYGEFHKFSPSLSLNYRSRKFNAFGSLWFNNSKTFSRYDSKYSLPTNTGETHFQLHSKSIYEQYGKGGRGGLDWFIGEKSTIGFLYSGYSGGFDGYPEYNQTKISGDNPYGYNSITTNMDENVFWYGHTFNLNYEYEFSKTEKIILDSDIGSNWSGFKQDMINQRYDDDVEVTPSIIKVDSKSRLDIGVLRADYEKELKNNIGLEAGLKATLIRSTSENKQLTGDGTTPLITSNENEFIYDENVYAAYASLAKKWKKWEGDFGFRTEYTFSKGYSPTLDSTVKRNYINLFPNVSLKRVLSKTLDLSFAYTRRIDRPAYWRLNPFDYQQSEFLYYSGNPFLQPQYSDAFTAGLGIESAVFFTLGFTNTIDAMTEVLYQKGNSQNLQGTTVNLDNIYNFNFNAVAPIPITKWWLFNFNGTAFYNHQISHFEEGDVDNSLWSYSLNMQQIFTLPKDYKIELSGYYNSPVFWNTFYVEDHYQLDLAISKKVGRFDFNLAFQDFLGIRESFGYNQQGNLHVDYYYAWETRQVRLNVGYALGNKKVKDSRQRKSASQEAQKRGQ